MQAKNKKMKLLTTGEFAKLCRIRKETLFFYDKEDILKPTYVTNNGYRYYSSEQIYDFDMIVMLQDSGSSLKEIKHCLQNRSPDVFLPLLAEKRQYLKQERARLAQRQKRLDAIIHLTHDALQTDLGISKLEQQDEELFELFEISPDEQDSDAAFAVLFAQYMQYFDNQGRTPDLPFGAIIIKQDVLAENYVNRFFFSKAGRSTPKRDLHIKPKGLYAVFAHQGTSTSHDEFLRQILASFVQQKMSLISDIYGYDMMSYITVPSSKEYMMKYCVGVKVED